MLVAYTDAGRYGNYSIHSYVVKDGKRTVLRDCMVDNVRRTTQAEIASVKFVLEQCRQKGVKGLYIHTDNQGVVNMIKSNSKNETIQQIIELMIQTDSDIKWVARAENKTAHRICENMKRVLDAYEGNETEQINPKNHVYLRSDRSPSVPHRKGWINPYNLTTGQRNVIKHYYHSLVIPGKRHSMEKLFEWGMSRMTSNTKQGRLHFVERYVSRFHTIDEVQTENSKDVFGLFYRDGLTGI